MHKNEKSFQKQNLREGQAPRSVLGAAAVGIWGGGCEARYPAATGQTGRRLEKRVQRGRVTQVPLQQVESRMSQVPDTVGTHSWAEGHLKG